MSADAEFSADASEKLAHVAPLRPALVSYFRRKCGNETEAEDLAHDVMIRALQHARWANAEEAKGYIFRIAVNRWHDRNRQAGTHGKSLSWDDSADFALAEDFAPENVLNDEQELDAVISALQELSERTRTVFMLARLERMKQEQIAAMFGISVSAVEKHIAKALAHLMSRAGAGDPSTVRVKR
jgi:RNA polymerase sigma-70 factor (ECF subfamily)